MDKKKEITDLSPQNSAYADKIAAARGVQHPVGGAPMPKMPNFADAQQQGDRYAGVQAAQQTRRNQGMATLLTPQERQQLDASGKGLPGVGSAYAVNQPAAAQLNQQNQPQGYQNPPRPEGAGISAQTAEQLAAVAKANSPDAPKVEEEKSFFEDDVFDYNEFGEKVKNLLANKERREAIEARCEPLDLMDLLVNREVRQVVPIIPGKYFPTFRTMRGDEDLEVKRLISRETSSTTFVLSKMTLMNLTCGLYAVNGKVLPSHMKEDEFNIDAFMEKYKSMAKYPMQVLSDLAVNYTWFDNRVRKLISVDAIKDF
jgi:hypothetical protein